MVAPLLCWSGVASHENAMDLFLVNLALPALVRRSVHGQDLSENIVAHAGTMQPRAAARVFGRGIVRYACSVHTRVLDAARWRTSA